jgi:hypothetical protein
MESNQIEPQYNTVTIVDAKTYADRQRAEFKKKLDAVLCHNCGWNVALQVSCGYDSTVKCFFGHHNRGIWHLGDEYILKEQPLLDDYGDNNIGADVATTTWLRKNTTIPVAEEMKHWKDQHSHFFLTKRVQGESLEEAWPRLSTEE